ncbi:hypothetical protein [Haliovirga abyssi]|uniref:DUF4747 family protein n=1 Tax=Haliovirga abyssi TaxID=2996794 RepID=A0AAU9DX41_9FUSO|nr:hypothetical protein [Haliovirga abyssi]BDU50941.1 hypothetical protein HLVA_15100 [Haliovirga abyssi]
MNIKGFKYYNVANFNCTFGEENEPMLNYFDTIIYPALKSELINKSGKNKYFAFKDIEIIKFGDEYALKGCFVKKTELEIKSDLRDGQLIEKNEIYSTAPFSLFIILLSNHRLILIKNQKGSPTIKNFETHTKGIIKKYIRQENKIRKKLEKDEEKEISLLPDISLNIVAFPSKEKLRKQLEELQKINRIELKIYPLNGEVIVNDIFNSFREEIEILKANSGNVSINSPKNYDEVANLVEGTKGTAKSKILGVDKSGQSAVVSEEEYKEELIIELPEHNSEVENTNLLIEKARLSKSEMRGLSKENKDIYENNLWRIERIFNNPAFLMMLNNR